MSHHALARAGRPAGAGAGVPCHEAMLGSRVAVLG